MTYPPPDPPPGWTGPPPGWPEPPPSIGFSFSVAWRAFKDHLGPLLVAGGAILLLTLISVGLFVPVYVELIVSATRDDPTPRFSIGSVALALAALPLLMVVVPLLQANLTRMCLRILDGHRPGPFEIFTFHRIGASFGAIILVSVGTTIGLILLYVPGLVFSVAAGYTLFFVHDRNLRPVAAIKASFRLMRTQFGPALVAMLLGSLLVSAGSYVAMVGLVVTIPLGYLFIAHQFKALTWRQVG